MTEEEAREWASKLSEQEGRYWRQQHDSAWAYVSQAENFANRLRTGSTLVPIGEHRIEAGVTP